MERIFNIYVYYDREVCSELGYVVYEHHGDDNSGAALLKESFRRDLSKATRVKLKKPFTREEYNARARLGESHFLFEDLYRAANAGLSPLVLATPVVDGVITFNYSSGMGPSIMSEISEKLGANGLMDDWLVKYTGERGFDMPRLIHDDYFLAIKLTYNAGLYVSAMKLLMSCIDSVAYIDLGDIRKPPSFITWLETYVDLKKIGITAAEVWELRNGMLHMSNINSERVRANKIRRISFSVGVLPESLKNAAVSSELHYFEFLGLINAFSDGISRWVQTYNTDPEKFYKFVERYDEVVSDSRMAFAHVSGI